MAYCGPRGIPLSVFLGRPVAPGESQWLASDRDDALAWQAHENRRCGSCGTHPDDWAEDKLAYHAHLNECPGCRQRERLAQSDQAKQSGEGVTATLAHGSAADCPRCKPRPV